MITVALPVYNSKHIAWLCMESLARQKNIVPWELIVHEEKHSEQLGESFFKSYSLSGCKRIIYCENRKKISLSEKWHDIARMSDHRSKMFCLCAADNYYHPFMIADADRAYKKGYDWFYTTKGYIYDFNTGSVALYDRPDCSTGLQMYLSTKLARKIPRIPRERIIDLWIYRTVKPDKPKKDSSNHWKETLWTHGFGNISQSRGDLLNPIQPPFYRTDKRLGDIIPVELLPKIFDLRYVKTSGHIPTLVR